MKERFPLGLLGPAIALVVLVWIIPLLYAAALSCSDAAPGTSGSWVGFANYLRALSDARFDQALLVSVLYAAGVVVANVGLGLAVALALRQAPRPRALVQTLLLLPWVLSELAVALIWRGFLDENTGWINILLRTLGLLPVHWRTSPVAALASLWLAALWQGLAFSTLLQMAGLGSLPENLLQAAKLDGASRGLIFRRIVWPHQRRVLAVNALLVFMFSLVAFALPFALTGGGPLYATELSALYAYQTAFSGHFELGYSAAQGMVVLFGNLGLIAVLLRLRRSLP